MNPARSIACAALAVAILAGCGKKEISPPDVAIGADAMTPQDAFYMAQNCLKDERYEDLFRLLSTSAQDDFAEALKRSARVRSNQPFVRGVMGMDVSELAKLPPEEAFARTMKAARMTAGSLERVAGVAPLSSSLHEEARVQDVDIEGDRARLTALYVSGRTATHELVLENGQWKLTAVPQRPQ